MSKIKNLYLPGTNKNVGYILGDTMHIYKKYIKYFPIKFVIPRITTIYNKSSFIVLQKYEGKEENLEMVMHGGWWYNVNIKFYAFYNCTFKTPDNLDVIEMAYLYKHWNKTNEKKNSRLQKS